MAEPREPSRVPDDASAITECAYCGSPLEPDDCGTCDPCWYGMRQEPEEFAARIKALGRTLTQGTHGFYEIDGKIIHINGAPFKPGPVRLVKKA